MLVGQSSQRFDLIDRPATQRMLHHREAVVGQTHHTSDVSAGSLEWRGADDYRRFTALFKRDAVMHTARRATPSVTGGDNQKIRLARQIIELSGIGRQAGV